MDYFVDGLVEQLAADSSLDRRLAAETLGELGTEALPAEPTMVRRSIVDPVPRVRYALLSALERVPWEPDGAVPLLTELLRHEDEIAQARAAWALGRVGPAATVAAADLVAVAMDEDRLVDPRWSAVVALERLGAVDRNAASELRRLLHSDADPDMREAAARALGTAEADDEVVGSLVDALADSDQLVRESALVGLGGAGQRARSARGEVERLLEDPWPAVRYAAKRTLRKIAPDSKQAGTRTEQVEARQGVLDSLEQLLAGLSTPDDRARGISTFEIGKLGPEAAGAVPILVERYQKDENLDVRWSAAWAFGKMGRAAANAVPALLRGLVRDLDPDVRAESAWALGWIGEADHRWTSVITASLERALRDEDSLVREEAATALGQIGPRAASAVQALEQCSADRRPLVRDRARQAIRSVRRDGLPAASR